MHIFYRNNRYSDKRNPPPTFKKGGGGGGLRNNLSQVMHAAGFLVVYKFFI